ncbi:hypothetical protein [Actinophytocola gossypii]|uniref:Uncharacterized protein n=1 Tax=Actinophytocola gossypii TaxID=2812003 RepID=A0ABT2JFR4_9PSEU|nr:hypothetical protein [Actinophytocola gossypii]MCT2586718.1 hypothetical protein [Actinophytocola gossypii]
MTESPEQRLYEAATRWDADWGHQADLIDAACAALVDGVDSPTLRELAGASARDYRWDVQELVARTFEELDIPAPGTLPNGSVVTAGGGIARRSGVSALRLSVAPAGDPVRGFQVLAHVDGVEPTSVGAAGLGMDPYDLLVPTNRLAAPTEPHTVPFARCVCGDHGCGGTEVTITRDGDRVHWDWSYEVPMDRGVTFPAVDYDREVARVAADHTWETPERTAGRLVLTGLDHDHLLASDLHPTWVANDHRDPTTFRVALRLGYEYQIFVDTPWRRRTPEQLATAICRDLSRPPGDWTATWLARRPTVTTPPPIAGRRWRRRR